MLKPITAALILAAIPVATLTAQSPLKADEDKPVTRAEISARLDADYADLDADHDGKVTPAEIDARLRKSAEAELEVIKKERDASFARFDTNGDGSISRDEFDARAKLPTIKDPDAKPFLDRFDANKDGSITRDEFRTPTLANFERMDRNKDGTVTPAEQEMANTASAARKPTFKSTPTITR